MKRKRRNVVLFLTDGQRRDTIGCYGSSYASSPCIDAFAGKGVRFDQAFANHTVCMPTRASIYTGCYPHSHGVWANGVPLAKSTTTLAQILAEAGYATCASGKIHFEPQEAYREGVAPFVSDYPYYGFQEVHLSENMIGREYLDFVKSRRPDLFERARNRDRMPEEFHDLQWITDRAIDFIKRHSSGEAPFFCHCSFHELIPPCRPPSGFVGRHDPGNICLPELTPEDLSARPSFYRRAFEHCIKTGWQPDEAELRKYIASAHDQAEFIDKQFGRIVETLKERKILDDTIVIFMTDHGLSFNDHYQWRHGPFLFDEVIRVPMIWRVPDMNNDGLVCGEMVEQVDIMPTLLELNGVEIPSFVQGESCAGLFENPAGFKGRDSVLIQDRHSPDLLFRGVDPASVHQVGLRTARWKFITYVDSSEGELYDLENDPGEFRNLWSEPDLGSVRKDLGRMLDRRYTPPDGPWPERTHDW